MSSLPDPSGLPDLSVFLPDLPHRPEQFVPFAALVQTSPACRLWTGQPLVMDACQGFAFAAGMGLRVPVGTAVALAATRHPFEAAQQARGLALCSGHDVVMGFGAGDPTFQRGLTGRSWARPLTAMREFVTAVRGLLAGEAVDQHGEYFTLHGRQPQVAHPRVDLGLGVLRPRMAALAGEIADAALTWLTPPDYLAESLVPVLEKSAAEHGRPRPRVVAAVHVALARPDRDPVDLVARTHSGHLSAPHYQAMLARAGVRAEPDDLPAATRALVASGTFLHGGIDEIAGGLRRYAEAGVDEVALHLHGAAAGQGLADTLDELAGILSLAGRR